MKEKDIYKIAKRRAYAKMAFYIHLAAFIFTNLLLSAINLTFSPAFLWFIFPLFGGALGVGIHGLVTFLGANNFKARLIETEMKKLTNNFNSSRPELTWKEMPDWREQ